MPPRPIRGAGKLPARAAKRHPEHLGGSVRQHFIPCAAVVFVPDSLPMILRGVSAASPELSDKLGQINADFRAQQYHYFDSTSRLNWVCCASALILVGGLLFLIMFETGNQRMLYLAVLILSFVFMIGPAFHSIMSAIVGFLQAPLLY